MTSDTKATTATTTTTTSKTRGKTSKEKSMTKQIRISQSSKDYDGSSPTGTTGSTGTGTGTGKGSMRSEMKKDLSARFLEQQQHQQQQQQQQQQKQQQQHDDHDLKEHEEKATMNGGGSNIIPTYSSDSMSEDNHLMNNMVISPSTGTTTTLLIQPHNAAKVIKGEIHNVLTVMRVDIRYASPLRFFEECTVDADHPLLRKLRDLHTALCEWEETYFHTLQQPDALLYIPPFCEAISGREISASITGAALSALHKFLLYGFILPDSPSASEGMTLIAQSLLSCTFEETSELHDQQSQPSKSAASSTSNVDTKRSGATATTIMIHDEQVVLKLLELSALVVRCSLSSTPLIPTELVVGLLDTCLHVSHRAKRASLLLKSAASDALGQIVLQVFAGSGQPLLRARGQILAKLASLLNPQQHSDNTCAISLTLVNIAFETCREKLAQPEITILQNDLCRYLLQWTTTHDLVILSLTLRVIFNLFQSIRNHLKVPLEVFLTSVHLRILDPHSTAPNEEREVALESLVEFCQEPALMQDIYLNYDCDVQCTNLFESICTALGNASAFYDITNDVGAKAAAAAVAAKANRHHHHSNLHPILTGGTGTTVGTSESGHHNITMSTDMSVSSVSTLSHSVPSAAFFGHNKLLLQHNYTTHPITTSTGIIGPPSPHIPFNIVNRLALEGVVAILASIGRRCRAQMIFERQTSMTDDDDDGVRSVLSDDASIESRWIDTINNQEANNTHKKRKRRKEGFSKVANAFNSDPMDSSWLQIALEQQVIQSSTNATNVAELLYMAPILDKVQVGLYLSKGPEEKYPFEAEVRSRFCEQFDFSDMSFSTALRKFLSKFRLPGEAQCIDRLMESFSKELYRQKLRELELQNETDNQKEKEEKEEINYNHHKDENDSDSSHRGMIFKNSDAIYVLAFSTIMLNTDLHNRNMKEELRMTVQQFVKNNRGINDGEDLPEEFLIELYNQIKRKEIRVRVELDELIMTHPRSSTIHEKFNSSWDGLLQKTGEVETAVFTPSHTARKSTIRAGVHDRDMFIVLSKRAIQCFSCVFARAIDDVVVYRALNGFKSLIKMCDFFQTESVFNDILQALLGFGREFILGCVALEYAGYENGAPVLTNGRICKVFHDDQDGSGGAAGGTGAGATTTNSGTGAGADGATPNFIDTESPMPVNLLLTKNSCLRVITTTDMDTTSTTEGGKSKGTVDDGGIDEWLHRDKNKKSSSHKKYKKHNNNNNSNNKTSSAAEVFAGTEDDFTINPNNLNNDALVGCTAYKGLLALDLGFVSVQNHTKKIQSAWPAVIECICALRDARGLPAGLSDLDDFADSNGNVLPLSVYATKSQKSLDDYYRSIYYREEDKKKGWLASTKIARSWGLWGKSSAAANTNNSQQENNKLDASTTSTVVDNNSVHGDVSVAGSSIDGRSRHGPHSKGELSYFSRTLLEISEASDIEKVIHVGSTKVPAAEYSIRALLDAVDEFPYDNDPILEQHAVFALELAARALLSNRKRASEFFALFLTKFESILSRVDDNYIPAPFVIERIVVTVLRSSIHLYDLPELRPNLRASLHLLMMALPRTFIREISDRMACGLAIILRASFQHFETVNEWAFMGDTLDLLANYGPARGFIFDGIASTVEYAIPERPPPTSSTVHHGGAAAKNNRIKENNINNNENDNDNNENNDNDKKNDNNNSKEEDEKENEEGEEEEDDDDDDDSISEKGRGIQTESEGDLGETTGEDESESSFETESSDDEHPVLTKPACAAVTRVLIRFVLGFYQGDLSLAVPAMLCLEKVYRHTVTVMLESSADDDSNNNRNPLTAVPDKELWQNVAVAIYSVCRSEDPETSQHGKECYQKLMMTTAIDEIPDDKWIAILYLMVNKQPPLSATISRANTFSVLGQIIVRLVPTLSSNPENWDDLADLITQIAALAEENLREGRRGSVSPLFKATLVTVTTLSNEMMGEDFGGSKEFNAWASETLLAELEKVGAGGGSIKNVVGTTKQQKKKEAATTAGKSNTAAASSSSSMQKKKKAATTTGNKKRDTTKAKPQGNSTKNTKKSNTVATRKRNDRKLSSARSSSSSSSSYTSSGSSSDDEGTTSDDDDDDDDSSYSSSDDEEESSSESSSSS